ncbi:MAG: hypothetical protein LCH91_01855 [Bacteroidetes bacterium]|nr:hypothetical protein [Bacteroidota bacterium]
MRKLTTQLLLLTSLVLTSCASSKIVELGGKASTKGAEVSQKGVDIYTTLANQTGIDKSQQDKVKVLTNPNPAGMALPDTKAQDFSKQIEPRIKAYKSLMNVYKKFALLTDSKFSDKTQEAVSALQDSYNAIEKLPDLPDVVKSKLPEVSKMISQSVQAKKVRVHNQILYNLSQLYLTLWNADLPSWDSYIERVYDDYANSLNTVDPKRYDAKKISQDNKEPFSDDATVILMYRLRNRDEIMNQKNQLKKELGDFEKALEELTKMHSEIAKEKADLTDITSSINKIEELLKEK